MNALDKLYFICQKFNINDDNEEKCYGVSINLIKKLTDLFFIIIGEKASTNTPLRRIHCTKKCNTDMYLWNHVINVV